jgi:hypothetical protein
MLKIPHTPLLEIINLQGPLPAFILMIARDNSLKPMDEHTTEMNPVPLSGWTETTRISMHVESVQRPGAGCCDTLYSCKKVPTFKKNVMSPSSHPKMFFFHFYLSVGLEWNQVHSLWPFIGLLYQLWMIDRDE